MSLKLCFIAPSEYGKNTAISILRIKYNIINIKLGEPLYKLQDYFYRFIRKTMNGEQDGELLQYLGKKIRKENPTFLLDEFYKKFNKAMKTSCIITNDDCRTPDFNFMKELGFVFIKINGYKRNRIDHTKSNPNSPLEWQNDIACDYVVDNLGTLEDYAKNLFEIVDLIKKESKNERNLSV